MLTLFRIATGDNWSGILKVTEYKIEIKVFSTVLHNVSLHLILIILMFLETLRGLR